MNPGFVDIGLCSRIDYGGDGYRSGLLVVGWNFFDESGDKFIIVAGGLVAGKPTEAAAKKFIRDNLASRRAEAKEAGETIDANATRAELRNEFVRNAAQDLARDIPTFDIEDGVPVKIYLITSKPYDGKIGHEIALELIDIRQDILYYDKSDERLPTKQVNRVIEVLVPERAQWRSRYASTAIDGIVRENQERSAQVFGDYYIVGCTGSYMLKPKGESPRDYMGLPMLSRPTATVTSENQVGVVTLRLSEDDDHMRPTNHTFKDLLMHEREFIPRPASRSRNQNKIIDQLIRGSTTEGVLADSLDIKRETVKRILKGIMEPDGEWPGLEYDAASRRYNFPSSWLKHKLRYPTPDTSHLKEDVVVAFGCLHAGSTNCDYEYFVNELVNFMERENATLLVCAGDIIEGLKHNLIARKEVIGGMNYTDQEELAGRMVSAVLLERVERRFYLEPGKQTKAKLIRAIRNAIMPFVYIPGNHDEWEEELGFTPTIVFRQFVETRLIDGINKIVKRHRRLSSMNGDVINIVRSNITNIVDSAHKLPSGIQLEVFHPNQGRASTTSLRAEHWLNFGRKSQLMILANFHTAVLVEKWEPGLGQRVVLQIGANKHGTRFEDRMGKTVDFGYGCVHISSLDGRIMRNTTVFIGSERERVKWTNAEFYKWYEAETKVSS